MAINDVVNKDGSLNFNTLGGFKDRLDNHDSQFNSTAAQLADLATVNNHTVSYTYDTNGNVQTVTEKDGSNNVIKTVTYTYNASGTVTQSVTVMNGKTVTTTYNYDSNANITSTSNVIS